MLSESGAAWWAAPLHFGVKLRVGFVIHPFNLVIGRKSLVIGEESFVIRP